MDELLKIKGILGLHLDALGLELVKVVIDLGCVSIVRYKVGFVLFDLDFAKAQYFFEI